MIFKEWLKKNNIKFIISVDDEHKNEPAQSNVSYYIEKGLRKKFDEFVEAFKCIDEDIEGILREYSSLDEKISFLLDIFNNEQDNQELKQKLFNLIEDAERTVSITYLLNQVCEDAPHEMKIKKYESFDDASNQYSAYIQNIKAEDSNGKILWLVDYELVIGDNKRTGLKLIEDIIDQNKDDRNFLNNNIFMLLSGYEKCDTNIKALKCKVYKISKSDIKNIESFYNQIVIGTKEYISWMLITNVNTSLRKGLEEAEEEILNKKQEILDYLLIQYPNQEGTDTLDFLVRIFGIISKSSFENRIQNDIQEVIAYLKEYESLCDSNIQIRSNFLFDLMHKENIDLNVNKLYKNINSGDIFSIYNDKYILLSQPCDISIRSRGERKLKNGILVKICNGKAQTKAQYQLKHFDDNEHYIDYRECKYVNLDVLDLCTFNCEGKAQLQSSIFDKNEKYMSMLKDIDIDNIDENKQEIENLIDCLTEENKIEGYINYPMKLKITRILYNISQMIDNLGGIDGEDKVNFEKIKRFISSETELIGLYSYCIEDGWVKYNIERIGNLSEINAYDVINEFTNYNSRIGKPGDITSYIKDENKMIIVKDISNNKERVIDKINDSSDIEKVKERILALKCINKSKIEQIDLKQEKIIIPKDLQYVNIQGEDLEYCGGTIRVKKALIEQADTEDLLTGVLSKISDGIYDIKSVQGFVDKDTYKLKDEIKLNIGRPNRLGDIEIELCASFDINSKQNIGSIHIKNIS